MKKFKKLFFPFEPLGVVLILLILSSCAEMVGEINLEKLKKRAKDAQDAAEMNENISSFEYLFDDESVNNSSISFDTDTKILRLDGLGGANPAGSFQGGGTGNKPIAALEGFGGLPLGDFSISYDYDEGQDLPWMNLVVDIDNDGQADHLFVPLDASGGTFSFNGATDDFKVVCVPSCGTWSSNQYNLSDYPDATIVDSTIADGGMPAGSLTVPINGVLFSTGSGSSETGVVSAEVFNIVSNFD